MILIHGKRPMASERGIALIVALLMLLLISAALMGMIMMSNTETNISANFRDEQTAFFASKAGIEEIRDRLRATATNSLKASLPTALPGAANGVLYITNPASGQTVTPWLTLGTNYPDDEICKEVTCTSGAPTGSWYGTPKSASAGYAASPILTWKWVRVMAKANKSVTGTTRVTSVDGATSGNRVCWNGSNEAVTTAASCSANIPAYSPVYVITALAVTPSGSRRITQREVAVGPSAPVVAGIYSAGNSSPGNSLNVDGKKEGSCPTCADVYAVESSATLTLGSGTSGNYYGSPISTRGSAPSPFNVTALANSLRGSATSITTTGTGVTGTGAGGTAPYSGPSATLGGLPSVSLGGSGSTTSAAIASVSSWGTPGVFLANGNLTLGSNTSAASGNGVLIVQGNLTINVTQGFQYYGLIIATGNVTITGSLGASKTASVNGAIIAGGTFDATGISAVSGSFAVQQDPCFVDNALGNRPLIAVADRELIY